jgi:hypothetical protein
MNTELHVVRVVYQEAKPAPRTAECRGELT